MVFSDFSLLANNFYDKVCYIIYKIIFNSQVSSWFFTTKGIDCEEMTRDQADPTISGYSSNFQTLDARLKRVSPVVISGLQHF